MPRRNLRKPAPPYSIRLGPEEVRALERAAADLTRRARATEPHAAATGPRALAAAVVRAWLSGQSAESGKPLLDAARVA